MASTISSNAPNASTLQALQERALTESNEAQQADGKQTGQTQKPPAKALAKPAAQADKSGPAADAPKGEGATAASGSATGNVALALPADVLQKGAGRELLAALMAPIAASVVQAAADEQSSAAGLGAFSALVPLLGQKTAGAMAELFPLRQATGAQPTEAFSSVLTPETFAELLANVAAAEKGQLPANGLFAIAAQVADGADATAAKATPATAKGPSESVKKYIALVAKYLTHMQQPSPQALLSKQPGYLAAAAQAALPQIRAAMGPLFKHAMGALKDQLEKLKEGDVLPEAVSIPSQLVVAAENALKGSLLAAADETERELLAVRKDPKQFQALQAAVRRYRESGSFEGVEPKLAALAKKLVPAGDEGSAAPTEGQPLAMQASAPTESAALAMVATAGTNTAFGHVGVDIATADIGMLMYWIMMQVADSATEELRDVMGEMQTKLKEKNAQRELISKMKQQQLVVDNAIVSEFNELKGSGLLHADTTIEMYKQFRPVQYADDGTAQLPPLDAHQIPVFLREGAPVAQTAGGGAAEAISFARCDPAYARMMAEKYGVSEGDIQALYAHWDANPQLTGKNGKHDTTGFEEYLRGEAKVDGQNLQGWPSPGLNPVQGAMLKPVGSPPDAAIVEQNQKNLTRMQQEFADAGAMKDATAQRQATDEAAKVQSVDPAQSVSTLIQTQNMVRELELLKLLKASGADVSAALAEMEQKVAEQLKKPLNPAEQEALATWQKSGPDVGGSLAADIQQLASFVGELIEMYTTDAVAASDDLERAMEAGWSDDDNYHDIRDWGWHKGGPVIVQKAKDWDGFDETFHGNTEYGQALTQGGIDDERHTRNLPWPDKANAGPLFDLMTATCGKIAGGGWLSQEKFRAFGQLAKERASSSIGQASYAYGGPAVKDPNAAPPPPPGDSRETQLANQWGAQRAVDEQRRAAEAQRKLAEQQAGEQKLSDTNLALQGGGPAYVDIDATGRSADGRSWRNGTLSMGASLVEDAQGKLDSMGDLTDLMQMRLQMYMDRRAKAMETLSNVMKKLSQTSDNITQNMK